MPPSYDAWSRYLLGSTCPWIYCSIFGTVFKSSKPGAFSKRNFACLTYGSSYRGVKSGASPCRQEPFYEDRKDPGLRPYLSLYQVRE